MHLSINKYPKTVARGSTVLARGAVNAALNCRVSDSHYKGVTEEDEDLSWLTLYIKNLGERECCVYCKSEVALGSKAEFSLL